MKGAAMTNTILCDLIRADREYMQLFDAIEAQWKPRPLPVAVTGLCEGAAGALYISLIRDLRDRFAVPILMVCADEREAVRLRTLFENFGCTPLFSAPAISICTISSPPTKPSRSEWAFFSAFLKATTTWY